MAPDENPTPEQPDDPSAEVLSDAPAKRGKVVGSFAAGITFHANAGDDGLVAETAVPSVNDLERLVADALYNALPYFHGESIVVSASRTDR